ncbi:MAG: transglutaminase domain-containing protein, partial [Bacteroidota bacterium]
MLCLLLSSISVFAQSDLPIVYASSELIDIRDGESFSEGQWRIMPEYQPDIYTSNQAGKTVTFYTDLDSISYTIHPDSIYDFIVLLNGKDSAYTQIKYEPSYMDILKGAAIYDATEAKNFPEFTYEEASSPNLQKLREELKLDSIAGEGNEVSKILNLLHWIHELIPHDGSSENPKIKNALSMIDQCDQEDRGLNCRGLSIALNECYLAM